VYRRSSRARAIEQELECGAPVVMRVVTPENRAREIRSDFAGAPGRTRTCDPRLRRPPLYPTELRARTVRKIRHPWELRERALALLVAGRRISNLADVLDASCLRHAGLSGRTGGPPLVWRGRLPRSRRSRRKRKRERPCASSSAVFRRVDTFWRMPRKVSMEIVADVASPNAGVAGAARPGSVFPQVPMPVASRFRQTEPRTQNGARTSDQPRRIGLRSTRKRRRCSQRRSERLLLLVHTSVERAAWGAFDGGARCN
jgi:hypothetical protein